MILAQADQTNGSGWFNGDDAVVLLKGATVIDSIGQRGIDPGTEWGTGLTSTADNTLRRKAAVEAGDPDPNDAFDPAVQWDGFATDDFTGLGAHVVVDDAAPQVSSTTPAAGATGVAVDADVTVTFSEPVTVSGSWFSISCTTSGAHAAAASGGPLTFTLNPGTDFVQDETCTATIVGTQVSDNDADDPPDTMTGDAVWSFTTIGPPARIHDIQGAAHRSPLEGHAVSSVPGIVTAKVSNGFFFEDPNPDASTATSEGLFVFTSAAADAVAVGDAVVAGFVTEFRPGGATGNNLTQTEITAPDVDVLSSGNALPGPSLIGKGGRVPPDEVIDNDSTGDAEVSGVFDPAQDGLDFYESFESMRAQVNKAWVVGPTSDFGEIPIVGDTADRAGIDDDARRRGRPGERLQPGADPPRRPAHAGARPERRRPLQDARRRHRRLQLRQLQARRLGAPHDGLRAARARSRELPGARRSPWRPSTSRTSTPATARRSSPSWPTSSSTTSSHPTSSRSRRSRTTTGR